MAASTRCGSTAALPVAAGALPESALPVGTALAVAGARTMAAAQPIPAATNLRFIELSPFERIHGRWWIVRFALIVTDLAAWRGVPQSPCYRKPRAAVGGTGGNGSRESTFHQRRRGNVPPVLSDSTTKRMCRMDPR